VTIEYHHLPVRIGFLVCVVSMLLQCGDSRKSITSANNDTGGAIIAGHKAVQEFDNMPDAVIGTVKSHCNIYFGHTSHGSQILTGMAMLRDISDLYDYNNGAGTLSIMERIDDLGSQGDTSWAPITRNYLISYPQTNVVIWSWCGGCSDNTESGINIYLNTMSQLEKDYPHITFVYMTGHLDGTGPGGNLYARNNQIRSYCTANKKVLFDFADIESYDPDGTCYPNADDACPWCYDWCAAHTCPSCNDCAHSHCFNCYLKGKAFWWIMGRIAGWKGN
jgi:hypothetical protein